MGAKVCKSYISLFQSNWGTQIELIGKTDAELSKNNASVKAFSVLPFPFLFYFSYNPFARAEQNVVFPSGHFDYMRNQAWKRLLQFDKILVKLRGHLYHKALFLGTWTFSSWNHLLTAMFIIKMIKIDTKNHSPWFLILAFWTIIKKITEKLPEMLGSYG